MRSLRVPFSYPIEYVLPRKRTTERIYDAAEIDLQFREYADAKAPLVARIALTAAPDYLADGTNQRYFLVDPTRARELRFANGRHWFELGKYEQFASMLVGRTKVSVSPFADVYGWADAEVTPDPDGFRWKHEPRTWTPKREQTEAALRKAAAEMMVVGDTIFEEVGEPFLKLHHKYDDTLHVRVSGLARDYHSLERLPEVVPLDNRGDRLDQLARLVGKLKAREVQPSVDCRVEVVRPDLLFRSPAHRSALDGVGRVMHKLSQGARYLHREAADAFLNLRDAVSNSPWHMGPEVRHALELMTYIADPPPQYLAIAAGLEAQAPLEMGYHHHKRSSKLALEELSKLVQDARRLSAEALEAADLDDLEQVWSRDEARPWLRRGDYASALVTDREQLGRVSAALSIEHVALERLVKEGHAVYAVERVLNVDIGSRGEVLGIGISESDDVQTIRKMIFREAKPDYEQEATGLVIDHAGSRSPDYELEGPRP